MPNKALDLATGDDAQIITEALLSAKERLGLTGKDLQSITGIDPSTLSRMKNDAHIIQDKKSAQIALHFLRLYRSLDSITGNDETSASWLRSDNLALGGVPLDLIRDIAGLIHVTEYLDSRRAAV